MGFKKTPSHLLTPKRLALKTDGHLFIDKEASPFWCLPDFCLFLASGTHTTKWTSGGCLINLQFTQMKLSHVQGCSMQFIETAPISMQYNSPPTGTLMATKLVFVPRTTQNKTEILLFVSLISEYIIAQGRL